MRSVDSWYQARQREQRDKVRQSQKKNLEALHSERQRARRLSEQVHRLENEVKRNRVHVHRLENNLKSIQSSKIWRVASKLNRILARISGRY